MPPKDTMQPLTATSLWGTWAPLLLPVNADDSIDYGRAREQLERYGASGIQGVYTNGTSGEFWAQSEAECDRLAALTAEVCAARGLAYQLGASHPCPHTALERIRRARALAPGAIQVVLADWWPVRLEDAIRCLTRFAEAAAPVPLVLYNPPHAKRLLTPDEIRTLKTAVPALVGFKGTQYDQLLPAGIPGMALFAGGRVLADAWAKGARGSYSEVACMNPWGAARWYRLMERDLPAAQEIGRRLTAWRSRHIVPLNQQLGFAGPFNDKLFAAIGDWAPIGTRMRWPYLGVAPELAAQLRPAARAEVPEIFAAQP